MVEYTDFKAGLQNVNNYLDGKHHLNGQVSVGSDAARLVASAEYSFTMRELMCSVLSGNGVKLPNLQVGLDISIGSLLNLPELPNIQQEIVDALSQVQGALGDFMDHTKIDEIIGRANLILAEAQQVVSLLNFCGKPIDPIAIPNMLERSFGSFLGPGQKIMNSIGVIAPGRACDLSRTDFDPSAFTGGLLGDIAANINDIKAGILPLNKVQSLISQANAIRTEVTELVAFENNITGSYSQGGSNFSDSQSDCRNPDRVGVMHNPTSGSIADNANVANSLKSLYDNLAGYPVEYKDPDTGEVIPYANIFELLVEPEILDILKQDDEPLPTVSDQVPIYDYCGNIKGYREVFEQRDQQVSNGAPAEALPGNPGQDAGGYPTFATPGTSSTVSNTTIVYENSGSSGGGGGNSVYVVGSETSQLNLQLNTNDIVVRTDLLASFVRRDLNSFRSGTMNDFQSMAFISGEFINNLNNTTGNGIVVKDGDVAHTRQIFGTDRQVFVNNSSGTGGNFVIGLANDTEIPGNGSLKIPAGNTLQRSAGAVGRIRYNLDSHAIEAWYGDIGQWRSITSQSSTGLTALKNIGVGAEVFAQNNLITGETELRKINGNAGVVVTQNDDDITISDNITASNLTGNNSVGVFNARNNNDFQFKSLVAGGSIVVNDLGNIIEITDTGLLKTTATTVDNNTVQVLFNNNAPQPVADEAWLFVIHAIGVATTTKEVRSFKIEGTVQNVSGDIALVGSTVKTDYQRTTSDIDYDTWNASAEYAVGSIVEYELNLYEVTAAVSPWEDHPLNNSKWQLHYSGWNVSANIVNDQFQIRVKGESNKTVNWRLKLDILDII
jgi:hypothetical protein